MDNAQIAISRNVNDLRSTIPVGSPDCPQHQQHSHVCTLLILAWADKLPCSYLRRRIRAKQAWSIRWLIHPHPHPPGPKAPIIWIICLLIGVNASNRNPKLSAINPRQVARCLDSAATTALERKYIVTYIKPRLYLANPAACRQAANSCFSIMD